MAKVVQLDKELVLTCPECECQVFYILVDRMTKVFSKANITDIQCEECGYTVNIQGLVPNVPSKKQRK